MPYMGLGYRSLAYLPPEMRGGPYTEHPRPRKQVLEEEEGSYPSLTTDTESDSSDLSDSRTGSDTTEGRGVRTEDEVSDLEEEDEVMDIDKEPAGEGQKA